MSIIEDGIEMMDEELERRFQKYWNSIEHSPETLKEVEALDRCTRRAEENGTANMTLDEINEEIRLARLERTMREREMASA